MKVKLLASFVLFAAFCADGQGTTFLYDQQSSMNSGYYGYGGGPFFINMVPNTGQSFTPGLPGVDFIRLSIADGNLTDGLGSTWFLNLRSDSITGPILGTTATVYLADLHAGAADFLFPNTIPLTPGTSYFFDINSPDGAAWNIFTGNFAYPGGNAWGRNQSLDFTDYWFREGLVVPEPSVVGLFLIGGCSLLWCKSRKKQRAG